MDDCEFKLKSKRDTLWRKIYIWYFDNIRCNLQYKFLFKQIGHVLYWLRTHTYNRYHMLNISNKRNGYTWGWMDRSEGILFANFAILVDFVEKEKPFVYINWKNDEGHINAAKEMKELYRWWKVDRKREHDTYEALLNKAYGDDCMKVDETGSIIFTKDSDPNWRADCNKCHEMEDVLRDKDTENMIRLIKIRGYMWT